MLCAFLRRNGSQSIDICPVEGDVNQGILDRYKSTTDSIRYCSARPIIFGSLFVRMKQSDVDIDGQYLGSRGQGIEELELVVTDQKMRTPDAARYLGLSEATLKRMRVRGDGPVYAKAGPRIVVYGKNDLDAWLTSRSRRSTREPGSMTNTVGSQAWVP